MEGQTKHTASHEKPPSSFILTGHFPGIFVTDVLSHLSFAKCSREWVGGWPINTAGPLDSYFGSVSIAIKLVTAIGKAPWNVKPTEVWKKGTQEKPAELDSDEHGLFSQLGPAVNRPWPPAQEEMNRPLIHTHRYCPPVAQSAYSIGKY